MLHKVFGVYIRLEILIFTTPPRGKTRPGIHIRPSCCLRLKIRERPSRLSLDKQSSINVHTKRSGGLGSRVFPDPELRKRYFRHVIIMTKGKRLEHIT